MRAWITMLLLCLVVPAADAVEPSKVELSKEVEAAMGVLNEAFTAHDVDKVRSLMTPNHLAVTPFAGKQTLDEQIRTLADLDYEEYEAGPMSTTTIDDSCVLVTYALKAKGTYRGKPVPSQCHVVAVWVKSDGKWRELHYQETAVAGP